MPVVSVRIPQLGEGLQEALLVEFLKQPGDSIKRDEPIYVMETDKAVTEVESPYAGKLVEWIAEPNSVLPIGTEVAKMEVAEGVKEMPVSHGPDAPNTVPSFSGATAPPKTSVPIPPRTRKYLKEKGLLDVADQIPAAGAKLMVADVDKYLEEKGGGAAVGQGSENYDMTELPPQQIALNFRLVRGVQACVPVTGVADLNWTAIGEARQKAKDEGKPITSFTMLCWCIVQSLKKYERFRSTLTSDGKTLRTYHHVHLGIAVARPGDELLTAVVRDADTLSRDDFFEAVARQVKLARDGKDQVDESTTFTVSNIGKAGLRSGIPAVVPPGVGTLAVGEVRNMPVPTDDGFEFQKQVTLALTFDHRVINGVGAGQFLTDLCSAAESFNL
jgi:pyruvate dehydrogenase E2 component (dihydrolipoamide acetyltransferase)